MVNFQCVLWGSSLLAMFFFFFRWSLCFILCVWWWFVFVDLVSVKLGRLSIGTAKPVKSGIDDLLSSTEGGKHDYDWYAIQICHDLFVCRLNLANKTKKSHSVAGKSMCFISNFMLFQIIHRSGINCWKFFFFSKYILWWNS